MEKETVCITAVWLRSLTDHLIVEVEIDGKWRTVIDEFAPSMEFLVSHIAEARGQDRWRLSPMNQDERMTTR